MSKKTIGKSSAVQRPPLWAIGLGVGVLFAAALLLVLFGAPDQKPVIGGPFALTASDGRTVTDKDFLGKPFLVFFGYTHCPDVCPTSLYQMSTAFGALGPEAKISGVFVTVDPERDTPKTLGEYLSSFDPRIVGLTGDRPAIDAAIKAYRIYARKVPTKDGDYTMDHTAMIYLMDREGRFVGAVNLDRPPDAVAAQLKKYL